MAWKAGVLIAIPILVLMLNSTLISGTPVSPINLFDFPTGCLTAFLFPTDGCASTITLFVSPNPALPTDTLVFTGQATPHELFLVSVAIYAGSSCSGSRLGTVSGSTDVTGFYSLSPSGNPGVGTYRAQTTTTGAISNCVPFTVAIPLPLTVTPLANGAILKTLTPGGLAKQVKVQLNVRVTSNGGAIQGASVKFIVGGKTDCTTLTGSNGVTSCIFLATSGQTYTWHATADKTGYAHAQSVTVTFVAS